MFTVVEWMAFQESSILFAMIYMVSFAFFMCSYAAYKSKGPVKRRYSGYGSADGNGSHDIGSDWSHIVKRTINYGPQFAINELQDIKVKLTLRGQDMYKLIYIHRPVPKLVEGEIWTFDCAWNQVKQYFTRFGAEAQVISPSQYAEEMTEYYKQAYRAQSELEDA